MTRTVRSNTLDSRPSDASYSPNSEYDDLTPRSHGKTLFYEGKSAYATICPERTNENMLILMIEALPFYWLAQALHNVLSNDPSVLNQRDKTSQGASTPPAGSWNKFAGMDFKQMLQSARVFVRNSSVSHKFRR